MCVTVTARGQIFRAEFGNLAGFCTKIGNVDNNKFFCHFRIQKGKNKVRAAKACIYYCDIVGKCEFLQLLDNRRSKTIIGKQGISAPCNYDLGIQHQVTLTG